jgi:hypothetical protein
MSLICAEGWLFGDVSMSLDEYKRRCGDKTVRTVTIKVKHHGWEYTFVGVEPEIDDAIVRFRCDETTIFAKRPLVVRIDR